jgi:hypothetical protein
LCILVINPLSNVQLAKIFSHSVGSLFSLVTISFVVQKLFNLMLLHLSIFCLTINQTLKTPLVMGHITDSSEESGVVIENNSQRSLETSQPSS